MIHKEYKIGFLLISPNWAGAENALSNIAFSLSKENIKVVIYCNTEICNYYKKIKNIQVNDLGRMNFDSNFRYLNYLKLMKSFNRIISKEEPDVLFSMLDVSFFISKNIPKRYKFPVVVNLRGEEINNFINGKKNITRFFLKKMLKMSPKIISVSNNQIINLNEEYKKKAVVITNGVDLNKFKPIAKIKQKKNIVLFVGRIIRDKGIGEILSVAKQLTQYEFWFAGKGDLSNEINLSNTKYLGEKNSDELVKLYNQATICVLPSYHEGFSNVGLETIACGRSLICTPDFSEYIENGKDGIIIPAKDEKSLKDAIVDLMTNEKKRKMLEKNARKKALKYSWDNVAKQYMRVFKEVLRESEKFN